MSNHVALIAVLLVAFLSSGAGPAQQGAADGQADPMKRFLGLRAEMRAAFAAGRKIEGELLDRYDSAVDTLRSATISRLSEDSTFEEARNALYRCYDCRSVREVIRRCPKAAQTPEFAKVLATKTSLLINSDDLAAIEDDVAKISKDALGLMKLHARFRRIAAAHRDGDGRELTAFTYQCAELKSEAKVISNGAALLGHQANLIRDGVFPNARLIYNRMTVDDVVQERNSSEVNLVFFSPAEVQFYKALNAATEIQAKGGSAILVLCGSSKMIGELGLFREARRRIPVYWLDFDDDLLLQAFLSDENVVIKINKDRKILSYAALPIR